MPPSSSHIQSHLRHFLAAHPEDRDRLHQLVSFTKIAQGSLTNRKEFRGHVTVNAVLVNDHDECLMIRHIALERWLTPGGHVESTDADLIAAALRELTEETGIPSAQVRLLSDTAIDIDVHRIPENLAKPEPSHLHFDFRFLFHTQHTQLVLQEDEVSAAEWRALHQLPNERLHLRIRAALRNNAVLNSKASKPASIM
ncbi:NUDIX hydrolase [Streptomyces lydicus]|uniref:NUDIX hydrolase n=1 Tax=Streptomyces lydicus TaxID=47763 RepID=UPI0036FB278A